MSKLNKAGTLRSAYESGGEEVSHTPWEFKRQEIYEESARLMGKTLDDHEGYYRDNDGSWIITDNTGRVGTACFKGEAKRGQAWNAPDPEGQANARLIAAAPELYEALKFVQEKCQFYGAADAARERIEAALRKAEGRA